MIYAYFLISSLIASASLMPEYNRWRCKNIFKSWSFQVNILNDGCSIMCEKTENNSTGNVFNGQKIGMTKLLKTRDGTSCKNDGSCLNGWCVMPNATDTNITPNNNNLPKELSKNGKLNRQKCEENRMFLTYEYNDGCAFVCNTSNLIKPNRQQTFYATEGSNCKSNGFCHEGLCIDLRDASNSTSLKKFYPEPPSERCKKENLTFVANYGDECKTICIDEFNDVEVELFSVNGHRCENNGLCQEGKCYDRNGALITTFKNVTVLTSTTLRKFYPEPPSERCKKENLTFVANYGDECKTICIDQLNDVEVELFSVNGHRCENNGICHNGKCINRTEDSTTALKRESPNRRCEKENLTFVENHSDECTTLCLDEFTDVEVEYFAENGQHCQNNGLCQEGKCINTKNGPKATTYSVTTPIQISTTLRKFYPEPPSERCKKENLTFVANFGDECKTICIDEFNDVEVELFSVNGHRCENNGFCQEGKCVNANKVPTNTIYSATTQTTTSTTTTTKPKTSTSATTSTTLKKVYHESPEEKCRRIMMTLVENFNGGCSTLCTNEATNVDEELIGENGSRCDNNGICEEGVCVNMKFT